MRETCTSGSVGALGEQSPGASRPFPPKRRVQNPILALLLRGARAQPPPRPGYASALTVFVPKLRQAGVSEAVIRQITVDNPRRFLAFVPR